ncbi:hypothetical protein Tco_0520093 [Tanacetum coccineum]
MSITTTSTSTTVGESSAAAAARQPGPTMARRVDCSYLDNVETRVDVRINEKFEFYSRHHDAHKDLAAVTPSRIAQGPRPAQAIRECSYSEFLKCKPLELSKAQRESRTHTMVLEKKESVLYVITNAQHLVNQICDLHSSQDDALHGGMPMKLPQLPKHTCQAMATQKKMMTEKNCPSATSVDVASMYQREAIEFTTELMDDKTQAYVERQAERKRKYDDLSKNNQKNQQQQNKRQNTGQAYTAGNSDRKPYAGSKPLCSKCDYNHEGPCPPRCNNYKKVGHLAKDYRSRPANANNNNHNNNNNNQKGNVAMSAELKDTLKETAQELRNKYYCNQAGR